MLRYGVSEEELPKDVLDKEIAQIEKLGFTFEGKTRINDSASLEKLRKEFDAVFIAFGALDAGVAESMGFKANPKGIAIDGRNYQTNLPGVFAGGDAVRKRRLTVRAVADGKEAARLTRASAKSRSARKSGSPPVRAVRPA